jgi:two-component system sensor histidine kinase KdpD
VREITGYLGAAAGVLAVTLIFTRVVPNAVNTTVALSFLVVVLVAASTRGLGPAILASIGGVICFNYFFLPPKGSLTIADTQNWVALTAFLITAVVASQLSSAARARATDAERRREEVWKLYQLSRAVIIIPDAESAISSIAWQVLDVFGASYCSVLVPASLEAPNPQPASPPNPQPSTFNPEPATCNVQPATNSQPATSNLQRPWTELATATTGGKRVQLSSEVLARVFNSGETERVDSAALGFAGPGFVSPGFVNPGFVNHDLTYAPLNVGVRRVGILALVTPPLEEGTIEAVAGLVAVALERARFLREASRTEALRQSDELKSALLASVSHALRTPLTSIRAAVDNLLQHDLGRDRGPVAADSLREFHLIISEEVARLSRLVNNLLEMARIESGELHLTKEWTLVSEVFSNVLERCSPVLQNHATIIHVDDEMPLVKIDSRLVAEALVNIVENAAKYSPPGTEIKLEAAVKPLAAAIEPGSPTAAIEPGSPTAAPPPGASGSFRASEQVSTGELVITVADTGPGIALEELDRVFDKFYRSPSVTDAGTVGTGMGLAISRGIIVAHRGRLWADSSRGHGTVFTLAIPVECKAPSSTESESDPGPVPAAARPELGKAITDRD